MGSEPKAAVVPCRVSEHMGAGNRPSPYNALESSSVAPNLWSRPLHIATPTTTPTAADCKTNSTGMSHWTINMPRILAEVCAVIMLDIVTFFLPSGHSWYEEAQAYNDLGRGILLLQVPR